VGEEGRDLVLVRDTVSRFVRSRPGAEDQDREDVVQEAMTRLLENRSRLEPAAWEAYAVVSARNLLRDRDRATGVRRRHQHRLHEPDVTAGPEEEVLTQEEHSAVRRALTSLPPEDAELLEDRYGTGEVPDRTVPGPLVTRLARARARLRLAYLLEHTGVELPTERCRPVLEAVSSGDRRRQERIGAARHVAVCRVCATYAPVLATRRRALAAVHPLAWAGAAGAAVWAGLRRHPASGTAAAAVALAGVVSVGAALDSPAPPPRLPPAASAAGAEVTVAGRPLLPTDGSAALQGAARAQDVPVESVPADEGFWVGTGAGERVWVQLVGGGESAADVRAGDRVSFEGRAVAVPSGFASRAGLTPAEGAAELERTGVLVEVPRDRLVVR
jgi:RNA polymerase sigma factor (sigma-70 family)